MNFDHRPLGVLRVRAMQFLAIVAVACGPTKPELKTTNPCDASDSGCDISQTPNEPCAVNRGGCDANATCTSVGVTATCACNLGFSGDGKICSINSNAAGIDSYVDALPSFVVAAASKTLGTASPEVNDGEYACSTRNVTETRNYQDIVAYANGSDVIWPGAVVRGNSVDDGQLQPVVLPRQSLWFSASLYNISGTPSRQMKSPQASEYRDLLNEILSQTINGATPANVEFTIEEVQSNEQLALALGAKLSTPAVGSVAANLEFGKTNVKSRHVVKFTQNYFTVDVDAPRGASSFFDPSVTLDELKTQLGASGPPAYVSSVTYGRMVVFSIESELSSSEMKSALEFAYNGGVAEVGGALKAEYKKKIDSATTKAYILGGSGGDAAKAIGGYDALLDFIKNGGNYTKDSPAAPIAYKLRYLRTDKAERRMSLTHAYSAKTCQRLSQHVNVSLEKIAVTHTYDGREPLDVYGVIWVGTEAGWNVGSLWEANDSQYVNVKNGAPIVLGGPAYTQNVAAIPRPGHKVVLNLRMSLRWPITSNESYPEKNVVLPFEEGWLQDDYAVTLDMGGNTVVLYFKLAPI